MNLIVKSYMALAGVTGRQIAREAKVTETWVSLVINKGEMSSRIRKLIVKKINKKLKGRKRVTVSELWPDSKAA